MEAISEIGLKKSFRFVFFTVYLILFNNALISPFRRALLKIAGAPIGKSSVIMSAKLFNYHHNGLSNLRVGNNCFIGEDVQIDLCERVILDDHVTLSNRVIVITHTNVGYKDHPLQRYFPRFEKSIHFKRGCFVGAGAIIMPGVVIGKESVIAAGAVVTKNVPDLTIVAGVPAIYLRKVNEKKHDKAG